MPLKGIYKSILTGKMANYCFDLDTLVPAKPKYQRNKGRFVKGHTPHNKGKKWSEWMSEEGQAKALSGLYHGGRHGIGGQNAIAIVGINKDGKECFFDSSKDAERKTGIDARNIRHCCEGHRKRAGGIRWMTISEYIRTH